MKASSSLLTLGLVVGSSLAFGVVFPAKAAQIFYGATLNGASEAPPNASSGTGSVQLTYDDVLNTLRIESSFSGLTGNVTVAHIHAPTTVAGTGTAGVATTTPTFAGFPSGVTSGSYDNTLDLTSSGSYNASFITANGGTTTGAQAALISSLNAGTAYFNLHSTSFPGGEIRGFFTPVPEPLTMLGAGAAVAFGAAFKRRKA